MWDPLHAWGFVYIYIYVLWYSEPGVYFIYAFRFMKYVFVLFPFRYASAYAYAHAYAHAYAYGHASAYAHACAYALFARRDRYFFHVRSRGVFMCDGSFRFFNKPGLM